MSQKKRKQFCTLLTFIMISLTTTEHLINGEEGLWRETHSKLFRGRVAVGKVETLKNNYNNEKTQHACKVKYVKIFLTTKNIRIYIHNRGQYKCNKVKVKESRKIGKEQKTLTPPLAQFLTLLAKFYFWKRDWALGSIFTQY